MLGLNPWLHVRVSRGSMEIAFVMDRTQSNELEKLKIREKDRNKRRYPLNF